MTGSPRVPVEEADAAVPDTTTGTPTPAGRPRRRAGAFVLLGGKVVISLLSVAMLALTFYGWQFVGSVNSGLTTTDVFDGEQDPQAVPLDGAIDILLVGQDSRTDAQGNPLPQEVLDRLHAGEATGERQTDTMILVHIPQDGTRAVAISFPRDSWVELAGGYGNHKLNSAFVYAYNDTFNTLLQQGEDDLQAADEQAKVAGRRNLIATIEQLLGKPGLIDRYAEVNLASFYEVTNALGGVEVCLNNAVRERNSGVNLPAGRQSLQGVQALAFVRQRYGLENGDLDRIARQQAFLSGLVRKMLSADVLLNPARLSDVVGAVQKSVVLSKDWDLLQFAAQMRNLSGGNVEFHTIPVLGNAMIGGAAVLEIDIDQVRQFTNGLITGGEEPPSSTTQVVTGAEAYTADIYNGSGDANLGPEVRHLLQQKGFQGESSATVDTLNQTVVRYSPTDDGAVALIQQALGADILTESDAEVPSGQLQVFLGSDFHLGAEVAPAANIASGGAQFLTQANLSRQAQDTTEEPITAGDVPCVN
ncbi:LCP family protein [Saccharomonospora sp. NPDC046836]|uniref:LCP family protein n=1 Tax=Saccharomonospora sp. NPDC046836 TaxID=3156921 RepID=UPI0033D67A1D